MHSRFIFMWVGLFALVASHAWAADADAPPKAINVPQLQDIVIDGKADDWADRGYRVEVMSAKLKDPTDCWPTFRLGWDSAGLLVLIRQYDDAWVEHDNPERGWESDSIEMFLVDRWGGKKSYQAIVLPGMTKDQPDLRLHVFDKSPDAGPDAKPLTIDAKRTKIDGGYIVEARLPFDHLGIKPAMDTTAAFQIYINDNDGNQRNQVRWFNPSGAHRDTRLTYPIRLTQEPSAPVLVKVDGSVRHWRWYEVSIVAAREFAGKTVQLGPIQQTRTEPDAPPQLAMPFKNITLEDQQSRAAATVDVDLQLLRTAVGPVDVSINGKQITTLELPDFDEIAAIQRSENTPRFRPSVFTGAAFPDVDFEHPAVMENMIGRYQIKSKFFNASHESVTQPDMSGRYGAVVKVIVDDKPIMTRYATLYRLPDGPPWWMVDWKGTLKLTDTNLSDAVMDKYRVPIIGAARWGFNSLGYHNDYPARLLAGLDDLQTKPDVRDDPHWPHTFTQQWWVTLSRQRNGNDKRFSTPVQRPQPVRTRDLRDLPLRQGTPVEAGMDPKKLAEVKTLLTAWANDSDEAFVVCIARNGIIVHHQAYGKRDGKPMTTDTASGMASLTKLISGAAIMMLVDQGLVKLDDPISKYLPTFADVKLQHPITIAHLFTHTAGMQGHWGDDGMFDITHRMAELSPHLKVGAKRNYNGTSLALGGAIIEQVSGKALPMFYQDHILKPLNMHHTTVTNTSYDAKSTAMDMAHFAQMLLHGGRYGSIRFMSPATRDAMLPKPLGDLSREDPKDTWGIGCTWFEHNGLSARTFGHGAASSATLRIDLEKNLVISMTRNAAGKNFGKYHGPFIQAVVDACE